MKEKKKIKNRSALFYGSAVFFYLLAILCFAGANPYNSGIVWLNMGSVLLMFGSHYSRKEKEKDTE